MRKPNRKPPPVAPNEEVDPAVAQYETMPIEQVRAELNEAGIDPRETIAAVKALVEKALRRRHDRRSLHLETVMTFLVGWVGWMEVPLVRPS